MLQIFGTAKNRATQKALRWFKERSIPHQFVNLCERSLSAGELDSVTRFVPAEDLIDRESAEYRKRGLAYMDFDIREELLENPLLVIMPVVRDKTRASTGYRPELWETWIT